MSEIHSISPSYPIIKPGKIIREQENKQQQSNKNPKSETRKESEEDCSNDKTIQHIDEMV